MANTFDKIQTVTVGSGGAASIEFTSIPATYTDLRIHLSGRTLQGNVYGGGALQFNSDTGSNYRWKRLRRDNSGVFSDQANPATAITNWDMVGANATANNFSNIDIYISNYRVAIQKVVSIDYVGENNATEAHSGLIGGTWTNTAAITSIKLFSAGGNLVQYSTATLYGILNT
jgi:hypothetical protein